MSYQILDGDRANPGSTLELSGVVHAPYAASAYSDATVSLQDTNGRVLATGTISDYSVDDGFNPSGNDGVLVKLSATLDIPNTVAASESGEQAYIVWAVEFDDVDNDVTSVESIIIYSADGIEFGLRNGVGLEGFDVHGVITSLASTETVQIDVYSPMPDDEKLATLTPTISSNRERAVLTDEYVVENAWSIINGNDEKVVYNPIFHATLPTYTLPGDSTVYGYDPDSSEKLEVEATLDPYTLQWYRVDDASNRTHIGSSLGWVINNSISQAIHEMAMAMERGIAVPGLLQYAFSNTDYMMFLKMGRDYFNMLDKVAQFTMTAADGHLRTAWLMCAQYQAAASRQLQEALKAFDFSGLSTTLTLDLQTAYETYRSSLESQIESTVRPYKRQLASRGLTSGAGSSKDLVGGIPLAQGWSESTLLHRGRMRARWLG